MPRLVLMLGLMAAHLMGQGQDKGEYVFTGQGWRDWPVGIRLAYAYGFKAGYLAASTDSGFGFYILSSGPIPKEARPIVSKLRCLDDMTLGQEVAVVDKYITDHPEKWHKNVADLFGDAITKACADRGAH
jgi:hypothetical protein